MLITKCELAKVDFLIQKYNTMKIKIEFLHENESIILEEMIFLAEKGLILVESSNKHNRKRALHIAVILASFGSYKGMYTIAYSLFNKLKYFPSNKLVEDQVKENLIDKLGFTEELIHIINKKKNTITIGGEDYLFNDFQVKFYELIQHNKIVSVSAPTSTGKSFFIKKVVVDMLINRYNSIVYIVPTNALINEVMDDFRKELKKVGLNCVITSSTERERVTDQEKTLFVLTQERLYQLCNNNLFIIDALIIDEAQNVMEGTRGILLEYSIKYAQRLWGKMKIVFISPLINNPSKFIDVFGGKEQSKAFHQTETSVIQNIIKLNMVYGGYEVILNNQKIHPKIKVKKSSMCVDIANVVIAFNNNQNSIVYCNTVRIAMDVCKKLYQSQMYPRLENKKLDAFADFVEYIIDKDYCLGEYIRRGIAWHYGNLPAFIRMGIEELAYQGELKIIASTSTLLQGVNIPAQNIYIYNPKKGISKKMYSEDKEQEEEEQAELSNLEFWNLAGRAGRMGKDFSGNIILIQNQQWKDISRYDEVVNKVAFSTDKYQHVKYINKSFENMDEEIESKEMREYIRSVTMINKLNNVPVAKDVDTSEYSVLEEKVNEIINDFIPPKKLLVRLIGVGPEKISQLWNTFSRNDKHIEKLMLIYPLNIEKEKKHPYINHFKEIIQIINRDIMGGHLYKENELNKLAYMSYSWITEDKIKDIIFYTSKNKIGEKIDVNKKVKDQVKYLNNKIRFRLMRGIYIYQEILKEYLIATNRIDMMQKMINFALYLEVGACRPITIELISLGLMRDFAIELSASKEYKIREGHIIEDLKKINVNTIPDNYMRHKIDDFIKKL